MHNRPMLRKLTVNKVNEEEAFELVNSYSDDYIDYLEKDIVYGLFFLTPLEYRNFRELAESIAYYLKDELRVGYKPALEAIVKLKKENFNYSKDEDTYSVTILYKSGALV